MRLALVGATIYIDPFLDTIPDGVVVTDGTRIAAVGRRMDITLPNDAQVIDCRGLTVTAGFWNTHVHFFERKWEDAATRPAPELEAHLAEYLRYGFTSVVDCSSRWSNTQALRDRIAAGEIVGPRIYSTGEGLVPPHALPPDSVLEAMGLMPTPLPEVRSAHDATAATAALIDSGADAVKIFASGSGPSPQAISLETMRAVVNVAHSRGILVFVHPNSADDIARALEAGVDVIAHTTPRSPWSDELLATIVRRKPAITPTLMLWKDGAPAATEQLRAWIGSGGTVLFGTDAGATPIDPTTEYGLMSRAGMDFRDILASLTTTPAGRFSLGAQGGCVAEGSTANLVALSDGTLSRVRYTIVAGLLAHSQHGNIEA